MGEPDLTKKQLEKLAEEICKKGGYWSSLWFGHYAANKAGYGHDDFCYISWEAYPDGSVQGIRAAEFIQKYRYNDIIDQL